MTCPTCQYGRHPECTTTLTTDWAGDCCCSAGADEVARDHDNERDTEPNHRFQLTQQQKDEQ